MGEESFKLLESGRADPHVKLFGFDLAKDDEPWQFVITFKLPGENAPDELRKVFEEDVMETSRKWQEIFPKDHISLPERMKKKEFNKLVLDKVQQILEGPELKFTTKQLPSIDGDEVFLKLALQDKDTMNSLAERVEARARVKPSAYLAAHVGCPTEDKDFEIRHKGHRNLHNEDQVDNSCPAYVAYRQHLSDKLEEFDEPNQLCIIRRYIGNFIQVEKLQKADIDVCSSFFAVHQWRHLEELRVRGWNDFWKTWRWPSDETVDLVVQYTGLQVAFLFHLMSTFTRWLTGPAVLSLVNFVLRRSIFATDATGDQMHYWDSAYGLMLCLWTTIFLVRYEQLVNLKIFRWGVSRAAEIGPVRKEFDEKYRDSVLDPLQKFGHVLLCLLFMAEAIVVAWGLDQLRIHSIDLPSPEHKTLGIPNFLWAFSCPYLITLNIKIVDSVWTPLSSWLSRMENWRTDAEMKHHMIVKLFAVKFVVFYYPFAYTILIGPHQRYGCLDLTSPVQGGPDAFQRASGPEGCVEKLRSNLQTFFVIQVVSEAFGIFFTIAMAYRNANAEKKKNPNKSLTYVELQAKFSPYAEQEQNEGYMKMVLNFGFIAMFGVVCPSMSVICWVVQFPFKKLIAYKVSYAHQRVIPRLEEGIGAFRPIMAFIAYMGVTVTCYTVIFVFYGKRLEFSHKLLLFIFVERALMALKWTLESVLGSKTVAQLQAEEQNEKVLEKVLSPPQKDGVDPVFGCGAMR